MKRRLDVRGNEERVRVQDAGKVGLVRIVEEGTATLTLRTWPYLRGGIELEI